MAQKAKYFNDMETYELIMKATEPKDQKTLGRKVKNFDAVKWDIVADDIVFKANLAKFSQNTNLKKLLMATDDKIFVECSPYDNIWGNGLNITDTLNTSPDKWTGTNRLGKAIMKVREVLNTN